MEKQKGIGLKVFKIGAVGALMLFTLFFLSSCGGDGGGTTTQGFTLSGTVASGKPLQRTFVTFWDGRNRFTDVTDLQGKYANVDLAAHGITPPVLIRVQDPISGVMYSYAYKSGTANVHPLTDPIIRTWYRIKYWEADPNRDLDLDFFKDPTDDTPVITLPSPEEIEFIKGIFIDVIRNILVAANIDTENFDPIETPFEADSSGFDKILDETTIEMSPETYNLNIVADPNSDIEQELEATGGSTVISLDMDNIKQTDTTPPGDPNAPSAVQIDPNRILLTWSAPIDPDTGQPYADIAYYKVYDASDIVIGTPTSTMFIVPKLMAGNTYTFTIRACDGAGNCSNESNPSNAIIIAAVLAADTTPPVAPTDPNAVKAVALGFDQIELTWSGFSDPNGGGIIGYEVYSCDQSGANQSLIAKVPGTKFVHFNLTANTTYYYVVKAIDAAKNKSGASNVASDTTKQAPAYVDVTPPAAPTEFDANAIAYNMVKLTWTKPVAPDLAGYNIARNGIPIKMLDNIAITYTDTGLQANTNYSYAIKAFDFKGNISPAVMADANTPPTPASEMIAKAMTDLEDQNIPAAHAKFESAYALDPNNMDANFGLAITEGVMLLDDPNLISFFNTYETYKPTIENIVYGVLNNTYEVWGGSDPLCGNDSLDPNSNGYIKRSIPTPPVANFDTDDYYVIYTPPFSEVNVTVSGISGTGISLWCDYDAKIISMDLTTISATIGGRNLFGSSMTVYAPNGMTLSAPDGIQQKALLRNLRRKAIPDDGENDGEDDDTLPVMTEVVSLFNKLSKASVSSRTKAKVLYRSLAEGPPNILDVQSLINSAVLPTINSMITKLRKVEGKGYEFTITPAMTGNAEEESIVLDDGEFYAIDAMLSLIKSVMNILTAYNLNVNFDVMEYDPLSQLNNSTFFTLKSDGAARMKNAHTALQDAVDKAKLAYIFVYNEWGYAVANISGCEVLAPQNTITDNGIKLHGEYDISRPCEYGGPYDFKPEDDTDIRNVLNAAQLALAGQVTFTEEDKSGYSKEYITDGTNTVTFKSEPTTDPDVVHFSVTANATKFFTSPLDRTDLPTLGYDLPINVTLSQEYSKPVNSEHPGPNGIAGDEDDRVIGCGVFIKSNLPDYTLNGIFPNRIPEFGGMHWLESAVILDPNTWSGWNQSVATDGTSIYLYKQDYSGASGATIWKINPATGSVTQTYDLTLTVAANSISWISGMTWHNGALWATGGYGDSSGNFGQGVFQINLANSQSSSQKPAGAGIDLGGAGIGGLASDGTNLYVGVDITGFTNDLGIVKFNPTEVSEIPSTLLLTLDFMPRDFAYGGDYLWLLDGKLKVNPADGTIVKEYVRQGSINMYLSGKLYSVDAQYDMEIQVYREPGT